MNYIGIDVHKQIRTAVVLDDNEKVINQIVDFETSDEGLKCVSERYAPGDTRITIENLTTAHRVYHWFKDRGYEIGGLHTGHGCITEISKTDFKTDLEDAFKLARVCKDHFTGRRSYALAHFSDIEDMKAKSLCRVLNDCYEERDKLNLRIQSYMDEFGIRLPGRLKSVSSKSATDYLLGLGHPALSIMVGRMQSCLKDIEQAKEDLEVLFKDNEDVRNLMSIKGISVQTVATIYTAIDGMERFETP